MDSFANTPNFLTLSRIALVPVVVYLLFLNTHLADVLAAALFIIASITDFFDGYIARKQNIVTVYGKLMDPLADKFLIVSALIMLEHLGRIHPAIVIFLICREMAITGLRALASSEGLIIPASSSAKWKTATQMVAIPMLLIDQTYFGVPLHLIGTVLIVISLIISLGSAIQYVVRFFASIKEKRKVQRLEKLAKKALKKEKKKFRKEEKRNIRQDKKRIKKEFKN